MRSKSSENYALSRPFEIGLYKRNGNTGSRPVSAEAVGRLRLLRTDLAAEADKIEAAVRSVPAELARDARRKFGKGACRAVDEIARRIPIPPLIRDRRSAVWRFIRPVTEPDQLSVQVAAVLLNSVGSPGLAVQPFGLIVSSHAVARLLDRTQFRGDPIAAILQAHDALMALTPDEGERLFSVRTFQLPGAFGAFLATYCGVGSTLPITVIRTWIDRDQLYTNQQRDADAWAQLLSAQPRAEPHPNVQGGNRVPVYVSI